MTFETETIDLEDDFDELFDHAWSTWEDVHKERLSWIEEEYERAVPEHDGPGTVVVAFDGDEAGQKASSELMVKLLSDSPTRTNYLRSRFIHGNPMEQSIRFLSNWELADELSYWDALGKGRGMPEWWAEMCKDHKNICLGEITRRSRKLNDLGGVEYIKTYNASNTITSVLSEYGVYAVAGKTVRCPMHDDTSPSLSVSKDDGRAFCFNQSCILWHDGYGVDPFEMNKILSR